MAKSRHMPSRSRVAQRVAALAVLASVSACSHGGEPRHPLTDEGRQLRAPTSTPAAEHVQASGQSTYGIIRASKAVPVPDAVALAAAPAAEESEVVVPGAGRRSASGVISKLDVPGEPQDLPSPRVAQIQQAVPDAAHGAAARPQPLPPVLKPQMQAEAQHGADGPLTYGAGVAALSILAVAMLAWRAIRRRKQKAAEAEREAEQARADELAREAAAREEARVQEERRVAQAAAAAAQEAALAAEQERAEATAAAAAVAREQAQRKVDPRITAARALFDLLHRAERDVEPFLRLLDEVAPVDATTNASRQVVTSWHESILNSRNSLSEALARHQVSVDMHVVEPATDLQGAMSRLIDHAARMSALMVAQSQENSAILHWSRQLPGALVQLFWRAQTARYSSTLPQLPRVPDAPAPGFGVAPAPVPAARQARVQDKAIQQALRGGRSHAVRS